MTYKQNRWIVLLSASMLFALLAACTPTGAVSPSVQATASSLATQVPGQVMTSLPGLQTQVPALVTTQLPNAVNTLAAVPVTGLQFDQAYIDMIVPLNQGIVELAKVAQQRAQHQELKDLANQIVTGGQGEITQLKGWKQQWFGNSDTPSLDKIPMIQGQGLNLQMMDLQAVVDRVRNASEPFDQAFIDAVIPILQSEIAAANLAQSTSNHTELKTLAQKLVTEEQKDLDQLNAWRTTWFGSASPLQTPTP